MTVQAAAVIMCVWAVTLLKVISSAQVVFTEEPGPGPVLLPVGGHIIFNCSVSPGHTLIGWRVYVPDVKLEYLTDSTRNSESLALIGITVRLIGLLSTQLLVNAIRENLLTYALCEARLGSNDSTLTRSRVDVTVYGPPRTPTNLSLRVKDDFLTVSWFSSTIPNVSLTFDLVLINTRTSSRKEVTIYDSMQHQFSVEVMEDVQACDVLEVLVTGSNDAGVGNCADLKESFPALPNMNTIQHLLSKTSRGRVKLTVTFMMPMQCPKNSVTNYTLEVVLEDSGQNMTEQSTASSSGPAVSLEVEDLMENEAYTYSIVAINAIGRATTSSTSFLTTDVQGVSVCVVAGSTYSIQCNYIAGYYNASGCSYVLVGVVEDTRDINGTIEESSTVNQDVPNIKDYGRILVYDEDNVLVMNGTLVSEKTGSCTTTEITTTAITTAAITSTIYLVIGLLLCTVFFFFVAVIALIVRLIMHGCRPMRKKMENYRITLTNNWKTVNDHEKALQDGEMRMEVGMDESCPVELLQTDPVYSTLSTNSSRKEATPSQDKEGNHDAFSGTYSEINDIKMPIYHVLESNQPMRSISADQSQLRLSAGYFLSRGDTPTPVIRKNMSMPEGELIYCEISAISAAN